MTYSVTTQGSWVVTERIRLLIQVVEIGRGAWSQCRATSYQKDTVGHLG